MDAGAVGPHVSSMLTSYAIGFRGVA
jgi:hypothetical protein